MKNISKIKYLFLVIICFAACSEEFENVRPGLYTKNEVIETFPGDTVLVSGQVSNFTGMSSITFTCEAWGINKLIDLSAQMPTVFNYEYQMIVPIDATFNQNMLVTVTDQNGYESKKIVVLSFMPDIKSPESTGLPNQLAVDFDTAKNTGVWNLSLGITDDRALKNVTIEFPDVNIDETVVLTGRNSLLTLTIEFSKIGSYTGTITISDASGNVRTIITELVVLPKEDEDPYSDYDQMYVVYANENPDDYVDGYYRYMTRTSEYGYEGKIYAPADSTPFYFVPEKAMDANLFGSSPYVNSKLMNKNGYVVPVIIPKKGYYSISINLDSHSFSTESLNTSAAYTGPLRATGTGFTISDWSLPVDDMVQVDDFIFEYEMELVEDYTGDLYYCFTTADWSRVFRATTDGNYWFEYPTGSCIIYKTEYSGKVKLIIDTALPWGTIKKVN